jgi:hypothetical protein
MFFIFKLANLSRSALVSPSRPYVFHPKIETYHFKRIKYQIQANRALWTFRRLCYAFTASSGLDRNKVSSWLDFEFCSIVAFHFQL